MAALLAAVALAMAVVTVLVATARWRSVTATLVMEMDDGAREAHQVDRGGAMEVPPVVRRYLERSVGDCPLIRRATLRQEGAFQMGEGDAGWRPFTATQHVRAYPPGFVWDARISMLPRGPVVPVRVRDGYLHHQGMMKGAVASLLVVVDAEPTQHLAEGALYRYLAEGAWMPTRLLPGDGLSWEAVDDSTAEATLRDVGVEVSVRFSFDAQGDITSIYVPRRARDDGGEVSFLPWTGRFWDHQDVDGYRVPMAGEVSWVVDGAAVPYWRGRLTSVEFVTGG